MLRRPVASDRAELLRLNRASRGFHRGWVSPPLTAAAFDAFLGRSREPNAETRLICRRTDGAILGVVNVSQIVRGNFRSAYLGYYMGAPHARRGYMGRRSS